MVQKRKEVPLSTSPFYDTSRYDVLGMETSIAVHAISAFRGIGANFGGLFGGRSELLEKVFMDARQDSLLALQDIGKKEGADLIVGVEVDVKEFHKFIIFTASGTLLKDTKKKPVPKKTGP